MLASGFSLHEIIAAVVGGGAVGGGIVQVIKNRGQMQTRHADELAIFRKELMAELKLVKTEAKSEIEFLRKEVKDLTEKQAALGLDFAVYRERVRLLITYFRDGNANWRELALALEADEHKVDGMLGHNHRSVLTNNGTRILVVDDVADTRDVLKLMLVQEGYEVDAAPEGVTALRLFEQARIDNRPYEVAILDYSMPGLTGEEVCRLIRHSDNGATKIVFFTAHQADMMAGSAEQYNAEIWTKPLAPQEIYRKLRKLLDK